MLRNTGSLWWIIAVGISRINFLQVLIRTVSYKKIHRLVDYLIRAAPYDDGSRALESLHSEPSALTPMARRLYSWVWRFCALPFQLRQTALIGTLVEKVGNELSAGGDSLRADPLP